MKKEDFINIFVNIDKIEDGSYAMRMSQLILIKDKKVVVCAAIDQSEGLKGVYGATIKMMNENDHDSLFIATDFPGGMDVDSDFVAVHCLENIYDKKKRQIWGSYIPYDSKTGEKLSPSINTPVLISIITQQLMQAIFQVDIGVQILEGQKL